MTITLEELEKITGRSKATLSLMSKSLFGLTEVSEDGLDADVALKLLFKMGSFERSQKWNSSIYLKSWNRKNVNCFNMQSLLKS